MGGQIVTVHEDPLGPQLTGVGVLGGHISDVTGIKQRGVASMQGGLGRQVGVGFSFMNARNQRFVNRISPTPPSLDVSTRSFVTKGWPIPIMAIPDN